MYRPRLPFPEAQKPCKIHDYGRRRSCRRLKFIVKSKVSSTYALAEELQLLSNPMDWVLLFAPRAQTHSKIYDMGAANLCEAPPFKKTMFQNLPPISRGQTHSKVHDTRQGRLSSAKCPLVFFVFKLCSATPSFLCFGFVFCLLLSAWRHLLAISSFLFSVFCAAPSFCSFLFPLFCSA